MITQYLRPTAIGSANDWTLSAGASKVAAVGSGFNQLAPPVHDEDASTLECAAFNPQQSFFFQGPAAGIVSVVAVRWRLRAREVLSGLLNVGALSQFGGFTSAAAFDELSSGSMHNIGGTLPKWDGTPWTLDDLVAAWQLTLGWTGSDIPGDVGSFFATSVWIEVDYESPISGRLSGPREIGSRRLRARRLSSDVIEAAVPSLRFLGYELGSQLSLSHPDLPSTDGRGAGVRAWQRWPVLLVGRDTDEPTGGELLRLRDLRGYLVTFWDVGKTDRNPGDYSDGIASLTSGGGRTFYRASSAWVLTPAGTIVKITSYIAKREPYGLLIEGQGANELLHNAFKDGAFTGWTASGSGAITSDSSELLFDAATTAIVRSVKLAAAATISTDLQLLSGATGTIPANTKCRVSFWHKDDSGAALRYFVQRNVDSKYWRDSDQSWQVAKTWNPLPVSTSRARHATKVMDVGTSATTLQVGLGVPTTGTPNQVNHAYHAQVEKRPFATSAIVSTTAVFTREADQDLIQMAAGSEEWPPGFGSARLKVRPLWNAADVLAELKTLLYAEHDPSNYDWVYFDGPNARWVFERKAGGVVYRAVKSASPVAVTDYTIGARWTSSVGELGLPAFTISVFVDGAKGTDATAAALTTDPTPTLELGSKSGAGQADANLWAIEITQQVLSDPAMARY